LDNIKILTTHEKFVEDVQFYLTLCELCFVNTAQKILYTRCWLM